VKQQEEPLNHSPVTSDLVRYENVKSDNGVGLGPIFEKPTPAQLLSNSDSHPENQLHEKILYIEVLESKLREAEQEMESMQVVYTDIVRRVKEKSIAGASESVISDLQNQLARERLVTEQATREKNELIARMSAAMTESVMRAQRLDAAESLVEDLVAAHRNAEMKASELLKQTVSLSLSLAESASHSQSAVTSDERISLCLSESVSHSQSQSAMNKSGLKR